MRRKRMEPQTAKATITSERAGGERKVVSVFVQHVSGCLPHARCRSYSGEVTGAQDSLPCSFALLGEETP